MMNKIQIWNAGRLFPCNSPWWGIHCSVSTLLILKFLKKHQNCMPKSLPCNYFFTYNIKYMYWIIQFSSVAQSCLILCGHMDYSMPGFPVHHQLPELAQTHVYQVSDAIQPSHPLSFPSLAFNLSQHRGLFQWVSSSHQMAKVVELKLQHQSSQWIFRTDFLWDWLVWSGRIINPLLPALKADQSSSLLSFRKFSIFLLLFKNYYMFSN